MKDNLVKVCYKRNFLSEVVARIDFIDQPSSLKGLHLPTVIQTAVKKRYQIFEPSKGIIRGFEVTNQGVSKKDEEEFQQWTYHGIDREKSIRISKNSVVVALKTYKDYDEFKLDVLDPIRTIQEAEGDIYIARTGLRFINIFPDVVSSFEDIQKYFSPMLAGPFAGLFDPDNCSRNFLISEYLYGELKLRMQSGIYNPDYPARIKKFDFIVDIDAYVDTPHPFGDIAKTIDELHKEIQRHFEVSITKNLRRRMNESKPKPTENRRAGRVPAKTSSAARKTRNAN